MTRKDAGKWFIALRTIIDALKRPAYESSRAVADRIT